MAHPLLDCIQTDEKREKRLDSLEQKAIEVENKLLRASNAALEKRVTELETSLTESNQECEKLRQTIARMKSAEKDVIPSNNDDNIEGEDGLICNDDNVNNVKDTDEILDSISIVKKEEEIIYERILKLIDNMKSDCHKAINMKVPTESQLPMRHGSKTGTSKPPSPTDGLISPSKMIGRPAGFGISVITSNIPTSRAATPSGAISPPNLNSHIPTKSPTSPPTKNSHIPSRSNTPSSPSFTSNIVTSFNKKSRTRTGSCCSSNIPSRTVSPAPPANVNSNMSTGIPSGIPPPQRMMHYHHRSPVAIR